MSMAKNFAQHGVWGIDKYNFTSSSSSPLWTSSLALIYLLTGVNEVSPLILDLVIGTLVVFGAYFIFRRYNMQPFLIFIALLSIIFFTPLPVLILSGQEHVLQLLLTIFFVYLSAKALSDEKHTKNYLLLLILAPLIVLTRYEGLFLIFVVSILFILRRRFLHSLWLVVAGVLPIAIYGVISILNEWYFFPNSVFLKAVPFKFSLTGISKLLYHFGKETMTTPHIFILLLLALFFLVLQFDKQKKIWKDSAIMLIIFIATTVLHMLFARSGWFYRYEAYLVGLGIFIISIVIHEYLPEKISITLDKNLIPKYLTITLLILGVISPLAGRGFKALILTPQATTNIYEQQYQMGLFLKKFYQNECVAANDIGAVNYLADIKSIDLMGLANLKVSKLKMEGKYNSQQLYKLAKQENTKIAIVYERWFEKSGGIPSHWLKIGKWKINNNVVCGSNTVSFYAVDPAEADNLNKNLRAFSSSLPKDVVQSGNYLK